MADLEILRPEVISVLDALYNYRFSNEGFNAACNAIRAELLRLAGVEAELAALKADHAALQELCEATVRANLTLGHVEE